MKVIIAEPNGGAFLYIVNGFKNAFNDIGCETILWSGDEKVFKDFDPDLYIGCSGHRKQIPSGYKGLIAIHVNPFGDRLEPIHGVDINETKDAIEWTLNQRPNVVFGYGLNEEYETFWKNWEKNNVKFVGCPTAGDATLYKPNKIEVDYKIAFLGGRWPYKSHNLNSWLVSLFDRFPKHIAVYGWGGWSDKSYYKGVLDKNDSGCQFLSSAKVCPCICEPHTSRYGIDIPERFFKVALCGSLPIIDYVYGFDRYCENYLMGSNIDEYHNLIINYAFNSDFEEKRNLMIKNIRKEVLKNHTYHNRMMNLCDHLGLQDIVEKFKIRINILSEE